MTRFALAMLLGLLVPATAYPAEPLFDVDVTLKNTFDKDFRNLPVLLRVCRVFGRGVDFGKFNPDGFHVYDQKGREVEFSYRPIPPDFSMANDEIILVLPTLPKGGQVKFRFTNTAENTAKQRKPDINGLVHNPNNLIANGGFEKGREGWEGGKIVSDVVKSGSKALLIEVPGRSGNASAKCAKAMPFLAGKHYYFAFWAKSDNVARQGYKWPDAGGRIRLSGNPLVLGEWEDHIRVMDERDWYCYKGCIKSPHPCWWPIGAEVPNKGVYHLAPKPAVKSADSTLSIDVKQMSFAYLDPDKPARIWMDEVLVFEQPEVTVSVERVRKRLAPDGSFVFRSAPTYINTWGPTDPPRPYEQIARIDDAAAQGERKLLTLGLYTPEPVKDLWLEIGDLKGPAGRVLGKAEREVEFNYAPSVGFNRNATSLEGWVIDGNPPRNIDRPGALNYLVAYRIPPDAAPGKYRGVFRFKGNEKTLAEVPVTLEIADYPLKVLTERFVGLIYNNGCGPDDKCGVVLPPRDVNYYRYYSRFNAPYMMLFSRFLPFTGEGLEMDMPELLKRMKVMRDVAGCTAGVGLYWDCALDKHGRGGLWPRSGQNRQVYRAEIKKIDKALADAGLPRLVYMVWDEPRFFDQEKFGILQGTGAYTTSDISRREMLECFRRGGVFTHISCDGPGGEIGPLVYKFARKHGVKNFGFDTQLSPTFNRYQVGLMLASVGMNYWTQWYGNMHHGYHPHLKAFVRRHEGVGMGEGLIDLRYHDTLIDTINEARRRKVAQEEVAAAEKYLKSIFDFCTGDYYFDGKPGVGVHNGSAEDWGDDWFYDRWRAEMRRHTLAIRERIGRRRD